MWIMLLGDAAFLHCQKYRVHYNYIVIHEPFHEIFLVEDEDGNNAEISEVSMENCGKIV